MILIKNGRLINPKTNQDKITDILIGEGKILKIGEISDSKTLKKCEKIIDATNKIVAPGLIDAHVHFRDPGFTYKEDIKTGAMSAAVGGFTTVICMANTNPLVDNLETLIYVRRRAKETKINVLNTAAISVGFKGEVLTDMETLKNNGAVGFTDDGIPLKNAKVVMEAMKKAKELDLPLSFHEEDPTLIENAGINAGEVAKHFSLGGAPRISEDILVARDCLLALETGATIDIQHLSSKNSVRIIADAKKMGAKIFAEVTPQHFSQTEDVVLKIGALGKVNPPLRTEEDRLSLIDGLKNDVIDLIVTDHAPHSREEKSRDLKSAPSGMIGLETALAVSITFLVKENHLSLIDVLRKMTVNPAKLYKLDAGSVEVGKNADIVIFDENEKWTVTDNFYSKSSNSSFIGYELYGKVKYTICNGEIVYENI